MELPNKPDNSQDLLTETPAPEKSLNSLPLTTSKSMQLQPKPAKVAPKKQVKTLLIRLLIFFVVLNLGVEALNLFSDFIDCAPHKAITTEPQQYINSINKGQQAYLAENAKFANSIDELGLGIKTQTSNFKYSTRATKNAAFSYGMPRPDAKDAYETVSFGLFSWHKWWDKREFKGYIGAVYLVRANYTNFQYNNNDRKTLSMLCETNRTSQTKPADPTLQNGSPTCGNGTVQVTQ